MLLAVGLPFLDGALVINQRAAGRPAQAAFALSSPVLQRAQVFARVRELGRECVYVYCLHRCPHTNSGSVQLCIWFL